MTDMDNSEQRLFVTALKYLAADIDDLKSVAQPGSMEGLVANTEAQFLDLLISQSCIDLSIVDKPSQRKRAAPTNGLLTLIEAAARLGISIKTLRAHVEAGSIRYIAVGRGAQRTRRMFAPTDLDDFIANQTRRDVPCPSIRTHARHTGSSISNSEVIAFTAAPRPRPGGKRNG